MGSKGVSFLPPRSRHELVALYHAADLLAVPSRSEGGLVLVAQEALLCGLPVLVGDDPGLSRYRRCAGLHFCALSPNAVRQGILRILRNRQGAIARGTNDVTMEELLPTEDDWVGQLLGTKLPQAPFIS